ncbi:MAG: hypothetical protein IPO88_04590 [Nannocystis sp.]|uniref:lectin-like protein n=1 Tax=Nannocystis sp. TaxID=1962667 RepID=UPI00242436A5|nr:lectin-like protein [Nannocystis sp.]MBK9752779.1 hypothetical protein [Nannocystis sp.]
MPIVRLLRLAPLWLLSACFHDDGLVAGGTSSSGVGETTAPTSGGAGSTTAVGATGGSSGGESSGSGSESSGGSSSGCVAVTWYRDDDMDGHGDPGDTLDACEQPGGYVALGDDCDDQDGKRAPDLIEQCDGRDNDCDLLVDEYSEMNSNCADCNLFAYGASSYAFCTLPRVFKDARLECGKRGGDLLVIDDVGEDKALANHGAAVAGTIGKWYCGFNDIAVEGSFVWLDGLPAGYTNWAPGEPSNTGDEDCTVLYDAGDWNDEDCAKAGPYVCESPAPP